MQNSYCKEKLKLLSLRLEFSIKLESEIRFSSSICSNKNANDWRFVSVLSGERGAGSSAVSSEKPTSRPGERSGSSEKEVPVGDKARFLLDAEVMQ